MDTRQALIESLVRQHGLTMDDLRIYLSTGTGTGTVNADSLLASIRRMQISHGVPVSLPRVRAAFPGTEKAEFDRAVLALADQQQVYLTRHDHGWAMPEADRALLVHDGGSRLYAAVTVR